MGVFLHLLGQEDLAWAKNLSHCLTIRSSRDRFVAASVCGKVSHRRGHKTARLNSGVRPVYKHRCYLILLTAIATSGCASGDRAPVDIRNACNTFVSEFAPRRTPELRQGKDGLELVLSFTPTEDPEANAILSAARKGPIELVVHPSMERLHGVGEEGAHLVLSVSSEAHAEHVKKVLCF